MFAHSVTLSVPYDKTDLVPVDLLGPLIVAGVCAPERVLAHIRRLDDMFDGEADRASAIAAVAGHVDADAALEIALGIAAVPARATALIALAPYLPWRVLDATAAITEERSRAAVALAVAGRLPDGSRAVALDRALAAASALTGARARFRALADLLPHLPVEDRVVEAFDALPPEAVDEEVRADVTPFRRARLRDAAWAGARSVPARARLAALLAPEQRDAALRQVLAEAAALEHPQRRLDALVALVPSLPSASRADALRRAWDAAAAVVDDPTWGAMPRADAWRSLVAHLCGERRDAGLRAAMAAVVAMRRENWRAYELIGLAPHLTPDLLATALAMVVAVRQPCWRAPALFMLAAHLPRELLGRALEAAAATEEPYWEAFAVAGVVPRLDPDERRRRLAGLRVVELI